MAFQYQTPQKNQTSKRTIRVIPVIGITTKLIAVEKNAPLIYMVEHLHKVGDFGETF